ncbi:hypothetical protein O6490_24740, partial [Salmonella enterica subsp. enterica]
KHCYKKKKGTPVQLPSRFPVLSIGNEANGNDRLRCIYVDSARCWSGFHEGMDSEYTIIRPLCK